MTDEGNSNYITKCLLPIFSSKRTFYCSKTWVNEVLATVKHTAGLRNCSLPIVTGRLRNAVFETRLLTVFIFLV